MFHDDRLFGLGVISLVTGHTYDRKNYIYEQQSIDGETGDGPTDVSTTWVNPHQS